jgi:hypothetical protein
MNRNSGNRSDYRGIRFVGKTTEEMMNQENLAMSVAREHFDAVSAHLREGSGWHFQRKSGGWVLVQCLSSIVWQAFEISMKGSEIELWGDQAADGRPVRLATEPLESFSSEGDVWAFLEKVDPKIRAARYDA